MNAVEQFYHAFIPAIMFPFQVMWGVVSTNPIIGAMMVFGIAAKRLAR